MIKNKITFIVEKTISDKEGRFVLVKGQIEGEYLTLLNVYNPPEEGTNVIEKIMDLIIEYAQGILVLGGDFNLLMDKKLDAQSELKHKAHKDTSMMKKISKEIGLSDVWRTFNKTERDYTYFSQVTGKYSRLDYFFMFSKDLNRVETIKIGPIHLSDHAPVQMRISINHRKKSCIWRLNNSLLKEEDFKLKIRKVIKDYVELNDTAEINSIILWEGLKAVLRGEIIAYASFKKKQMSQERIKLEKEMTQLEKNYKEIKSITIQKKLEEAKNKMNDYLNLEVQKDLTMLRQSNYDGGPRAAKILAYKLRKQQMQLSVERIEINNTTLRNADDIANQFAIYYKELYNLKENEKTTKSQILSFFQKLSLPQTTETQNKSLVQAISANDVQTHISKLKMNKSPGSDGFTNEFYKEFKQEISPLLVRAFNWALNNNIWANTWNSGIITVVHKPGKNPNECASYRPISLLNTDHKILTAILAEKLAKIIPSLVKSDQTGFIQQRYLADNVRRTLNVLHWAQKNTIPIGIFTLDAEKAFDKVLWPYMFETLRQFGIHETFIGWVEALYKNPNAKVRVNGVVSSSTLKLFKGVRQGDPLSGLLFALCIEPLAERIRQDSAVKGLNIAGENHKLSLYADDIIIYLTNPESSIVPLMEIINNFGSISGYTLNVSKSEVMLSDCVIKEEIKKQYNFHWDTETIKYLGIKITKDLDNLFVKNFGELTTLVKQEFNRWTLIPFTLWERIKIIQMNILPRFLFLFTTLPIYISPDSFKQWDSIFSKFIWNHKKPRISFNYLKLSKETGGLGFPNFKSYYQAAHIRNVIEWMTGKFETKWRSIEALSEDISLSMLPCSKYKRAIIENITNKWVKETVKVWRQICREQKLGKDMIFLKQIAYDPDFSPNKSDRTFFKWRNKGLFVFGQLLGDAEVKPFEEVARQYEIPNSHIFRFIQMHNYIQQTLKKRKPNDMNPLVRYIINIYDVGVKRKHVTTIVNLTKNINADITYRVKNKWEKELAVNISPKEWKQMCNNIFQTTHSHYWKEFSWKILNRYFRTPHIQGKMSKIASNCWRLCAEQQADHTHIFWTCGKIKDFWEKMIEELTAIFKVKIENDPLTLLLGKNPENLTADDSCLFLIIRSVIMKQITRNWKKPCIFINTKWKEMIAKVYEMEKITMTLRNDIDSFERRWKLWKRYIERLNENISGD